MLCNEVCTLIYKLYYLRCNTLSVMQYVNTLSITPEIQKHSTLLTEKVKTLFSFQVSTAKFKQYSS